MLQQCASAAAGINADLEIVGAPARPRGLSVLQLTPFAPQREGDRCLQAHLASPGFPPRCPQVGVKLSLSSAISTAAIELGAPL
jgi:hypothetical protein